MEKLFHAAMLPAVLAAAAIIISTAFIPSISAAAQVSYAREEISEETGRAGTVPEKDSSDGYSDKMESEEAYIAADPDEDEGIRREKYYLLEALNQLEDRGFSPISLWAKVTGNEKILNRVKSVGRSAADTLKDAVSKKVSEAGETVSEKVQDAGNAAAEHARDTVQNQTEKAGKSLLDKLKGWIHEITGSGKESE